MKQKTIADVKAFIEHLGTFDDVLISLAQN